jgi:dihydrolipoamide dehydrogenase
MMYDVVIIGSGPGGYVCAIRAAQHGLKVCIIEKESLGGVCLNWGCIPTKSLLHSASVFSYIKKASDYGFNTKIDGVDIQKVVQNSRNTVKKLTSGVEMLLKKNKITITKGVAQIVDKNTVSVTNNEGKIENITTKNIVLATGATARKLPNVEYDENLICTAKGAMMPAKIPQNIVIIGGGVIGMEFASFYSQMGSNVTILEAASDVLQTEDVEIRESFKKIITTKNNIKIHTGVKIGQIKKSQNDVSISFVENEKEQTINAEKLIVSIGVIPNISNIGLEKNNIQVDKNCIQINGFCQTNVPNIFAIGDVTQGPWLAHKASHEGIISADYIAYNAKLVSHKPHCINRNNIPACIYTKPQIASIGLTEEAVKNMKIEYNVGKFAAIGNGKALASHDDDAFVKTITDKKTGEILGVHMIGEHVTELISNFAIVKNGELIDEDIMNTIFPHPTISEMIHESVLDTHKKAIHK